MLRYWVQSATLVNSFCVVLTLEYMIIVVLNKELFHATNKVFFVLLFTPWCYLTTWSTSYLADFYSCRPQKSKDKERLMHCFMNMTTELNKHNTEYWHKHTQLINFGLNRAALVTMRSSTIGKSLPGTRNQKCFQGSDTHKIFVAPFGIGTG